uniref:SWIM-type domain-containing protein n=1 Tax=Ananas comosus var. bracteatus TaxID=296719 RepID=A0A6V7QCN2_ANACO|nr:unnamed protein product [Ananas comosus var. bracteatus]
MCFLLDETTESFIWLFETFLEAMGGQEPKSIFTDQDQAMANAIRIVFPKSRHRLCLWHLWNNAKKHLAGIYGNSNFNAKFSKCLSGCVDEMEFQSVWEDMIKTFNLQDNIWLNRLYEIRAKWCTALNMDFFSAKTKSTQRSESTNSVFHQIFGTSLPLIQVIECYEKKAEDMRQGERDEDFHCKNGAPKSVISYGGILENAANVYTIKLFAMFKEEFLEGVGLNCIEVNVEQKLVTYTLNKPSEKKAFFVKFDTSDFNISCSCKLFESLGLLCRHSLRVLLVNNVNAIPTQYILHRWTKDAKKRLMCHTTESSNKDEKSARALRLSELNHLGHNIFDKGSLTVEGTKIVKDKLMETLELLEKSFGSLNTSENLKGKSVCNSAIRFVNDTHSSDENMQVLDPPCVRKKGLTNARIKSQLEKKVKRKKRRETSHVSQSHQNQMFRSSSSTMPQHVATQMSQLNQRPMIYSGHFQGPQTGYNQVQALAPFQMMQSTFFSNATI